MKTSQNRRTLLLGLAGLTALPLLQGCFPVVATGVGAGAMMIADRRSSGTYVEDEGIEWKGFSLLRDHFGALNHINVTAYNRNVLLTGEVQNDNVRAEAERLIGTIQNVKGIINELRVGPASSLTTRANDGLITSNVKARFVDANRFSANHVKVVTEANIVFLMGLVTRSEADAATEIARTSQGVSKVVRVFEIISDEEALRLSGGRRPASN
ncbi:BON domain-containing protein [Azoarcus communis]|uniref:BON domain-containing protein n=1 Tax=Parazoarcus communis TaxID=41977 RepID=UPI001459E04E|nr:BON domain-containing protein [Parazoarcus communis]NMG47325.1 BON domain-containing protein [Parazoarcus communis]